MTLQARLHELLDYDTSTGVFRWKVGRRGRARAGSIAGSKHPKGYLRISIDCQDYLAHRLAWVFVHGDIDETLEIDHKNGIRDDNRVDNLRLVNDIQNSNNQQARLRGERRKMLGASYHKPSGKWISRVKVNGKDKYLGLFDTPEEANQAYLTAKRNIAASLCIEVELL